MQFNPIMSTKSSKHNQDDIPELTEEFLPVGHALKQQNKLVDGDTIPELVEEVSESAMQAISTTNINQTNIDALLKQIKPQIKSEVKKAILKELIQIEKSLTAKVEQEVIEKLKQELAQKLNLKS